MTNQKYLVCFKHREICLDKSEDYITNLRVNNFLQEHIGCPITLLDKKELSEYSTKRFREFYYMLKRGIINKFN